MDMQQFRLGGPESVSREEVRRYFWQTSLSLLRPDKDTGETLQQILDRKVKEQFREQPAYIKHEGELRDLYGEPGSKLADMQASSALPETEKLPSGYTTRAGARYRSLSNRYGLHSYAKKIDLHLANRKKLHRAIRLRLRREIKEEMRSKHKAILAESTPLSSSSSERLVSSPSSPKKLSSAADLPKPDTLTPRTGFGSYAPPSESFLAACGVDADALDNDDGGDPRCEPECWVD